MNEVNPLQVIHDESKEYFDSNPEATEFRLQKAVIGQKLEAGLNKQGAICKALVNEYPFIKDGKGFLTIDREGFEEWRKLEGERFHQETEQMEMTRKYPELENAIRNNSRILEEMKRKLEEMTKQKESQEAEIEQLGKNIEGLPDQLRAMTEKKETLKAENDRLQAELQEEVKRYHEEQKRKEDEKRDREMNKFWLFRRKPIEYEDSIAWKFVLSFLYFLIWLLFFYGLGSVLSFFGI